MMIHDPFHILIVLLGIISAALILTSRYEIARKISPVIMILFFSALLSNIGIIPSGHSFYIQLYGYAVPFAVCQILLQVRLTDIKKTGWPMLKAFAVAGTGSFLGCLLAGMLLIDKLNEALAGQGWKLAGPYIGTYIGGSLNFISLWSGLDINNPELFAAANAVDNLALIPIFMFWILCPQVLKKWYAETVISEAVEVKQTNESPAVLTLNDLIILAFIGFLIILVSDLINKYIITVWMPKSPSILVVTTIALLAAQLKSIKKLQGTKELGNFAFYLFFAVIGAMMDIPKAVSLAPVLFLYVALIIIIQIIVALLIGCLLKIDIRIIAVASIAAKAGPQTVAAYTNAKNWNTLALPGVAAALLGYAIGTYAGMGGAYLLKFFVN
jgi:uncharacterized membrane protein